MSSETRPYRKPRPGSLAEHLAARAALAARQPPPAPAANAATPAPENSAITRCLQAFEAAFQTNESDSGDAPQEGQRRAFRQAMPVLYGRRHIADFVACVAQGVLLGVFEESSPSRLLYAAQVAHQTTPAPLSAPEAPLQTRRIHRKSSSIACAG